jgi:undecaprenyl-phosphate 4-deoxy-4-formamido-L-arabinose transferase
MTGLSPGISVAIPIYNSSATLEVLVDRLTLVLSTNFPGRPFEIILVDDGSSDDSWEKIDRLSRTTRSVRGIRMYRNYGQHAALLAAIRHARYDTTVTMDDDLQHPPEQIPVLTSALTQHIDLVYGLPSKASHNLWRRTTSRLYRVIMNRLLGVSASIQFSSFKAFRTELREAFRNDVGPDIAIDALLCWATTRLTNVQTEHRHRSVGKSNYTYRKLLQHALHTITFFSVVPLRVASYAGLAAILLGVGNLTWVLGRRLVMGQVVPGFSFLASSVSIFSGVQILMLGIFGEYLAAMHYRLLRKPTYVIRHRTWEGEEPVTSVGEPRPEPRTPLRSAGAH